MSWMSRKRRRYETLREDRWRGDRARWQGGRALIWLLALVVGLGGIVGYSYLDRRGFFRQLSLPTWSRETPPGPASNATRPLYRWQDAQGRWQVTDQPPQGRPYETVIYRQDANVIPADKPKQ